MSTGPRCVTQGKTLIILDYDDTLCPSTEIRTLCPLLHICSFAEIIKVIQDNRHYFMDLIVAVNKLLQKCESCCDILILSNGETEWVSGTSAALFETDFTKLYKFISAREYCFSDSSTTHLWKQITMRSFMDKESTNYESIIGIGDSLFDRDMVLNLNVDKSKTLLKSIKLNELPKVDLMKNQMLELYNALDGIIQHNDHLDIQMTVTIPRTIPHATTVAKSVIKSLETAANTLAKELAKTLVKEVDEFINSFSDSDSDSYVSDCDSCGSGVSDSNSGESKMPEDNFDINAEIEDMMAWVK